jgi:RNA methyltransferase, TrmH family
MISSSRIKWIKSLQQKKFRWQEGFFVAEGEKIVEELVQSSWQVAEIYSTDADAEKVVVAKGIPFFHVKEKELERISTLATPNKSLAVVKMPSGDEKFSFPANEFSLLLDNIQDPGNLGTIIRTAEWFGVKNIICSHDTVDVYNPKVIQSTMGSFLRMRLFYADAEKVLSELDDSVPVLGALLDGDNLYHTDLPREGLLIIGNESKGISAKLTPFITKKLFIPRGKQNQTSHPESLNASVAASVILSWLNR